MHATHRLRAYVGVAAVLLTLVSTGAAKYGGGQRGTQRSVPDRHGHRSDLAGDSPGDYDKHIILTADIDLDPNLPGRKVFDKAVIAPNTNGTEDIWWINEGQDYPRLWWERDEAKRHLVIDLDPTSFDAQIADGVVLIDFYATWCLRYPDSHCVSGGKTDHAIRRRNTSGYTCLGHPFGR